MQEQKNKKIKSRCQHQGLLGISIKQGRANLGVNTQGPLGRRSGKVREQKMMRGWKSGGKDFIFSHFCLVESEKVKGWKK